MNANRRTSQCSKRRHQASRARSTNHSQMLAGDEVLASPWGTTDLAEAATIEAAIEAALDELEVQAADDSEFLPPAVPMPVVEPPRILADGPQLHVVPAHAPEPVERPMAFAEGSQPNIAVSTFSPDEEAFFAEGVALCQQHAREADELARKAGSATVKLPWWRRMFGRSRTTELAFD